MGDILFQLVAFLLMFGVLGGIVFIVVSFRKRSSKLDRLETKVDRLLEKEKAPSDR
ncbi:hypothetical protein [Anaerobacillus sp. 1_MG-2023]|uniref:hypothetical protein n=1 Tax=Bacillales TaxID=1385 RepID=UPI0026E3EC37|nr:hypothetical protein [Anaerobacillus sp. 1_MG-2023]MDO6654653.1 hypothetical protein [Anaerobacillus sp. 1_MG-2023]